MCIYGNYQGKMAKDFGVSGDESQTSSFWVVLCDLLAILNFRCQQLWRVTSRQQLDPRQQRKRLAVTGDVGNNAEAFVQWSFLIWVEENGFSPLYFAITIESSNQPSCYKERKRSSSTLLSQWTVLKNNMGFLLLVTRFFKTFPTRKPMTKVHEKNSVSLL